MSDPMIVSAPYAHQRSSVRKTMVWVMLALTPATLYGIYLFGWPALMLFGVTVIAALIFEALSLWIARKPVQPFVTDGSAIVAAWLLTMSLPPWAPWWIGVVGAFCAVVLAKQIFGGLGQNIFNPAMVARVALLISFPLEMTFWVSPAPLGGGEALSLVDALGVTFASNVDMDAISTASPLGYVKTEVGRGVPLAEALAGTVGMKDMALGLMPGSMGETSTILLLLGGLVLIFKRIISWHIPVSMIATMFVMATVMNLIFPDVYPNGVFHVLGGGTVLGAFFIATDLVTSPVTNKGKIVFGVGCGALIYIIRTWAGFPEGLGFAVLLMNSMTPLIDHYIKPRIYGRTTKGEPLQYETGGDK